MPTKLHRIQKRQRCQHIRTGMKLYKIKRRQKCQLIRSGSRERAIISNTDALGVTLSLATGCHTVAPPRASPWEPDLIFQRTDPMGGRQVDKLAP